MEKKLKTMLQHAMEAPAPERKQEFLCRIRESMDDRQAGQGSRGGYGRFVAGQVFYIGKWGWCGSFGAFLGALLLGGFSDKNLLWTFSAAAPFLAVVFLAEGLRSEMYGMAELEMTARFSLKSLVLARMGIMGAVHMLLLCLGIAVCYGQGEAPLLHAGVYLTVPYLLTNGAGLYLARKMRGRECMYAILAAAAGVAVLPFGVKLLYQEERFIWWMAALPVFAVLAVKEWKKSLEGWEEVTWNLS